MTSIKQCIHNIVRCLFHGIPRPGGHDDAVLGPGPLVLPSLLPKIYASLQALYFASQRRVEERFARTVQRLRKLSDACLAQYLGSQILERHVAESNGPVMVDTVRLIRQLPLCIQPGDKLDVVVKIFDSARHLVKQSSKADEFGADELLPIIEFVLIRGAIQNLGIEIQFIKDFLHPDIQGGQKGLWFCHFYAAYKSLSKVWKVKFISYSKVNSTNTITLFIQLGYHLQTHQKL